MEWLSEWPCSTFWLRGIVCPESDGLCQDRKTFPFKLRFMLSKHLKDCVMTPLRLFSILACFLLAGTVSANSPKGYEIQVQIQNYESDSLFLGFYYGDKQYLKDTAVLEKGRFVFRKDEPLPPGTYLLVLRPDNSFVQININKGKQDLDIRFDAKDAVNSIVVKGDPDNEAFYKYVRFLGKQRPLADSLRTRLAAEGVGQAEKEAIERRLKEMNQEVSRFQQDLIRDYSGTITAQLVASVMERELPEFPDLDEKDRKLGQYRFFMDHYFDGLDLNDERLVRTSFFFGKINDYVNKHTVQVPDSVNKAIDQVLQRIKGNEEAYKFFLVHFVNTYAKSNIIGFDAIYVHIVDNYYAKGEAPWVEEEQLSKMVKNAETLRPILMGKIAPDIRMERRDGSKVSLHEFASPYTVLIFWAPDCGHCQKTMPKLMEFQDKFRPQGVEVFAVCTKLTDKVPDCWKMVDEKAMNNFLNVVDTYHQSRFSILYDVRSTPQIFILDDKKEILFKRLSIEQLDEVMTEIIDRRKKQGSQD